MIPVRVYVTVGWDPKRRSTAADERFSIAMWKSVSLPALPPIGSLLLVSGGAHELLVESIVCDVDESAFAVYCRDRIHVNPTIDVARSDYQGLIEYGFEQIGPDPSPA